MAKPVPKDAVRQQEVLHLLAHTQTPQSTDNIMFALGITKVHTWSLMRTMELEGRVAVLKMRGGFCYYGPVRRKSIWKK